MLRHVILAGLAASIALALSSCTTGRSSAKLPAVGEQEADRYLFDKGTEALQRHRWLDAREYFKRIVDTYPGSRYRQDAKLGVGDSLLGEKRIDTDILAASEFREFLRFFPLAPRADYAQYRLGLAVVRQTLSPERDQTATQEALRELNQFIEKFPSSQYMPDVLKLQREMRDKLSRSELLVGRHYFRTHWYPGAVARLEALLKNDPDYLGRDAAYFYLAESYYRLDKKSEALPYYERLVTEFKVSEFLKDARKRLAELEKTPVTPAAATAATR
jgi:outer membrane protein assembly factor BamD